MAFPSAQLDLDIFPMMQYHVYPDFENLKDSGVDAIQFNLNAKKSENMIDEMYSVLYGWNCDSTLILNRNVIVSCPFGGAQL